MANHFKVTLDKRKLEQLIRRSPQQADDLVEAAAREGERIVKMSFGTGAAGRTYTRGGVTHTASAPGGPPAIDTGKLMNAIAVYRPGAFRRQIHTGDTEYAPMLEFGTRKMAARPFMGPMAEELRKLLPRLFAQWGRGL